MRKKILIVGTSGHAKVIVDILEKEDKYEIFGLIDTYKEKGLRLFGYTILGSEGELPSIIKEHDIYGGFIAIGDNYTRKQVYKRILKIYPSFKYVNAVHPKAVIGSGVVIGKGVAIMPGVIVNTQAKINDFCILNTKATLDHECSMGEYSSLGPGTNVGGNVEIGKCSAISLGAKVIENITIGNNTVVGAGALVVRDIADSVVAFGVPAKEVRERTADDKYLSGGRAKKPLKK